MKYLLLNIVSILSCVLSSGQVLIHAHNDYQKQEPLTNAIRNKVFSIEADVYLYNNKLVVAHDKNELPGASTLDSLYLQPIIKLFRKNKGTISKDRKYRPVLMIDIKENSETVFRELIKSLSPDRSVFDRKVNPKAVQIVISGDRGVFSKWNSYPSFIWFDGRPNEAYDSATLQRVAFISDSYLNHINAEDSTTRLEELIKKVHGMNKLLRLWATPDSPASWKRLRQLGIDIINTDKPAECRNYFDIQQSQRQSQKN
jgi:alkaline phosphatase